MDLTKEQKKQFAKECEEFIDMVKDYSSVCPKCKESVTQRILRDNFGFCVYCRMDVFAISDFVISQLHIPESKKSKFLIDFRKLIIKNYD